MSSLLRSTALALVLPVLACTSSPRVEHAATGPGPALAPAPVGSLSRA